MLTPAGRWLGKTNTLTKAEIRKNASGDYTGSIFITREKNCLYNMNGYVKNSINSGSVYMENIIWAIDIWILVFMLVHSERIKNILLVAIVAFLFTTVMNII